MNDKEVILEYMDEVGGVFHFGPFEAIPYNHWKKDFEWLVLIMEEKEFCAFVPVKALTAREACQEAVYKINYLS